jgi:DNA-binding MarR family transcriptional regulator
MGADEERPVSALDRRAVICLTYRAQRVIGRNLGRDLYSTPAWDMLLDLYIREERRPMSLTSLSGASPAPSRTSLREIDRLVDRGLLIRSRDEDDGRRINAELAPAAIALLDALFDELVELFAPP